MSNPYQIQNDPAYMKSNMHPGVSVCQPLADCGGWMQILGWGLLIYGCLISLTIFLSIIGIPLAIMGFNLKEAGGKYKLGVPNDMGLQLDASRNLGRFFWIGGILFMVWLGLTLLYIAFWLIIIIGLVAGAAQ